MSATSPYGRAAQVREQLEKRPELRREILSRLAPPYLTLAIDNDVRGFCDWQQFDQWPQSSQW